MPENATAAVATIDPKQKAVLDLRSLFERSRKQFELALPKHLNADRLIRIALTSVRKNPKLLECDPQSFVGALMNSAQLGLEPDDALGEAYLIPRWNSRRKCNEVNFQPGYKGLVRLAQNSGQIASIAWGCVRKGDHFVKVRGLQEKLEHREGDNNFEEPIVEVYAIVRTKDGANYWDSWPTGKIEAHRRRYAPDSYDGYSAWQTNWDWMSIKTVLIQALKLAPKSVELQRAIVLQEQSDAGLPQDIGIIDALTSTEHSAALAAAQGKTKLQQLSEKVRAGRENGNGAEPPNETAGAILDRSTTNEPPPSEAEAEAQFDALLQGPATGTGTSDPPKQQAPAPVVLPLAQRHLDEVAEIAKGVMGPSEFSALVKSHGGERGKIGFGLGLDAQKAFKAELVATIERRNALPT